MATASGFIIDRDKEFLKFLKARYPLFHLSNVFFRDLHYGVMAFLENNGQRSTYTPTEAVTRDVAEHFVQQGIFRRLDDKTWLLLYPEFKAIAPKKPAPAKPAAAQGARPAAAPKPAAKPAAAPSAKPAQQPGPSQPSSPEQKAEQKPEAKESGAEKARDGETAGS